MKLKNVDQEVRLRYARKVEKTLAEVDEMIANAEEAVAELKHTRDKIENAYKSVERNVEVQRVMLEFESFDTPEVQQLDKEDLIIVIQYTCRCTEDIAEEAYNRLFCICKSSYSIDYEEWFGETEKETADALWMKAYDEGWLQTERDIEKNNNRRIMVSDFKENGKLKRSFIEKVYQHRDELYERYTRLNAAQQLLIQKINIEHGENTEKNAIKLVDEYLGYEDKIGGEAFYDRLGYLRMKEQNEKSGND